MSLCVQLLALFRERYGKGDNKTWKKLLLKSPQGNGQAGNDRAAQDTWEEGREELDVVREKSWTPAQRRPMALYRAFQVHPETQDYLHSSSSVVRLMLPMRLLCGETT